MSDNRKRVSMTYVNPNLINNESVKANGKVSKSKPKRKFLVIRIKRHVAGILAVAQIGFGIAIATLQYKNGFKDGCESAPVSEIYKGSVCTYMEIPIEYGDTIGSIAKRFYNNEYYDGIYQNIQNFEDAICNFNNIENKNKIASDIIISVPLIFDENNEYYNEYKNVKQQIKEIETNEYWVDYVVKSSDSGILAIAALASGSEAETILLANKITQRNPKLVKSRGTIYPQQTIEIVNPKLGPLKIELDEVKQKFIESISNNQVMTKNK